MEEITFDLYSLTLGEAAEIEMASGKTVQSLLRSKVGTRMMAVYVQGLRNSAHARSWSELSSLRLIDAKSLTSPSSPEETPEKSLPGQ